MTQESRNFLRSAGRAYARAIRFENNGDKALATAARKQALHFEKLAKLAQLRKVGV